MRIADLPPPPSFDRDCDTDAGSEKHKGGVHPAKGGFYILRIGKADFI